MTQLVNYFKDLNAITNAKNGSVQCAINGERYLVTNASKRTLSLKKEKTKNKNKRLFT